MDEQNNTWAWVLGIVIVAALALGAWWYFGGVMGGPSMEETATTTENGAGNESASSVVTESRTNSSVASVVTSLSGSSRFASLLTSTGVSLSGNGSYTVFVPTDASFSALAPGLLESMTAAERKNLVQYHIVSGKMLDFDAVSAGTHTSLSGEPLNFTTNIQNHVAYVGNGYALRQYKASNGIVYVISAVLVPPQEPSENGNTGSIVPGN